MAKDKEKSYCVVDHANKLGDRKGVNPNRVARRQVTYRWPAASTEKASGTVCRGKEKPEPDPDSP